MDETDNPWIQLFHKVWDAHGHGRADDATSASTAWRRPTRWCRRSQAAGQNPTRDGIVEAIEEQGAEFEGPWLAPFDYSAD